MPDPAFTKTAGTLAREAGVSRPTVTTYAELGLIEFRLASNGIRLFRDDAAPAVREILARRLANRGGPHRRKL